MENPPTKYGHKRHTALLRI